ncbi:hypothetical protein [Puniceicoccus vermicola]|uniref:Uncharacterized protein n=1 Tax=Puniceicoccus vermicola TaxID=388746 RepID=A0A7X1AV00_9BACT|nr:hypothetical protein [Puniceicoccus vermicola]MBC2600506.1 hypothetical protein [Puniceicoccus vermicola]
MSILRSEGHGSVSGSSVKVVVVFADGISLRSSQASDRLGARSADSLRLFFEEALTVNGARTSVRPVGSVAEDRFSSIFAEKCLRGMRGGLKSALREEAALGRTVIGVTADATKGSLHSFFNNNGEAGHE